MKITSMSRRQAILFGSFVAYLTYWVFVFSTETTHFKLAEFSLTEWIWFALLIFIGPALVILFERPRRAEDQPRPPMSAREERHTAYLTAALVFSLAIFAIGVRTVFFPDKPTHWFGFVALGGIVLASLGWITQAYTSRRLLIYQRDHTEEMERKRYTLGLMQEFRSSRVYHEQRLNILRHFPNPTVPMTYNQLKQEYRVLRDEQNFKKDINAEDTKYPALASLNDFLNFYEQIALGIHDGDIDVYVIENTISGFMVSNFSQFKEYVRILWRRDSENLEHLRHLMNRWRFNRRQDPGESVNDAVADHEWNREKWIEDGLDKIIDWGDISAGPFGPQNVDKMLLTTRAHAPKIETTDEPTPNASTPSGPKSEGNKGMPHTPSDKS